MDSRTSLRRERQGDNLYGFRALLRVRWCGGQLAFSGRRDVERIFAFRTGQQRCRLLAHRQREPTMDAVRVEVDDLMQQSYVYLLTEPIGRNFDPRFRPELTPKQMLELGVFGGKYMTDCVQEYPSLWFKRAKLCHERHDPSLNYFGVNASSRFRIGGRKAGYLAKIRADGFNGYRRVPYGQAMR